MQKTKAPKTHKPRTTKAAHKTAKRAAHTKARATVAPAAAPKVSTTAPKTKMMTKKAFSPAAAAPIAAFKAQSFKPTKALFDPNANAAAPSPGKILFQAQKFIQQDIESLSKELSPTLVEEIQAQGFNYTVNNEGVITAVCKKLGFDVEFSFDREFEYDEQEDTQQGQENNEEDEGKFAFHNVTIQMAKNGTMLRLGGQMHLNGDLKINTFTPYRPDGVELRTVSTEDMSDGTVNAIFDALEVTALSDETCSVLLEIGRQERLRTHLESISFIGDFFGQADERM